MVTTRRSTEMTSNSFENASNRGGVDLLERPQTVAQVVQTESQQNTTDQTERMQKNLYNLLNYDRFTQENMQVEQVDVAN